MRTSMSPRICDTCLLQRVPATMAPRFLFCSLRCILSLLRQSAGPYMSGLYISGYVCVLRPSLSSSRTKHNVCCVPCLHSFIDQVILGIVLGAVLGFAFRHLMKFCERKDLIDRQSYVAQYVSLALLTIGANTLLGSDDLLAAFSCGTAFAWDGFFNKQTEESVFSSVIDLLFNVAAFVYVGAWMPFDAFTDASLTLNVWRLIVIAILVLLLRRLPIMIALYRWIPDIKTLREAVFSGHFGPMGIGSCILGRSCMSGVKSYRSIRHRCCFHFYSRCPAASSAVFTAPGPAGDAGSINPADCCFHGALLHHDPRAVHTVLLTRAACALRLAHLVAPRHLWDIQWARAPRVDDAHAPRQGRRGHRDQP